MRKTLLKEVTENNQKHTVIKEREADTEMLIRMMQEMKSAWQEAAGDLLQPRPEAIAQLLRKLIPAQ